MQLFPGHPGPIGGYLPRRGRIIAEPGLLQALINISLAECGFSHYARSLKVARDSGGSAEARPGAQGSRLNERVDERQEKEKYTRATACSLQKYFSQFDCRFLSAAGYHAGEKWVEGVMNHHDILDFRVMAQKKLLPDAGRQFLPGQR